MLELLLTSAGGGLLGSIITSVMGLLHGWQAREDKKLQYAHEIKLQEMQLASMKQETERELLIAEANASSAAMTASFAHDSGIGSASQWVVDVKSLCRPAITLLLVIGVLLVYFTTGDHGLQAMIVEGLIFCTIAAISWWFGARGIEKMVKPKLPWQ